MITKENYKEKTKRKFWEIWKNVGKMKEMEVTMKAVEVDRIEWIIQIPKKAHNDLQMILKQSSWEIKHFIHWSWTCTLSASALFQILNNHTQLRLDAFWRPAQYWNRI